VKLISKNNINRDIAVRDPVSAATGQLGVLFKKSVFLMLTAVRKSSPTNYFRSRRNRKAHNIDYVRFPLVDYVIITRSEKKVQSAFL
jgi:hypothetical protein